MQTLRNSKIVVVGIILIFIFVLWYNFFRVESSPLPISKENTTVGADLLKISSSLDKANLNKDLFSKPEYLYLTDFSIVIPAQPVGRPNPFANIGQ